jgi:hypothetical protein
MTKTTQTQLIGMTGTIDPDHKPENTASPAMHINSHLAPPNFEDQGVPKNGFNRMPVEKPILSIHHEGFFKLRLS